MSGEVGRGDREAQVKWPSLAAKQSPWVKRSVRQCRIVMVSGKPTSLELIACLHGHGLTYLAGEDTHAGSCTLMDSPAELLSAMAASDEPAIEMAITTLLLHKPELADAIPVALDRLENSPVARANLMCFYQAAAYIQREIETDLRSSQPAARAFRLLPDLVSNLLGLDSPERIAAQASDVNAALTQLAARHAALTGDDSNWLSSYRRHVGLMLRYARGHGPRALRRAHRPGQAAVLG